MNLFKSVRIVMSGIS